MKTIREWVRRALGARVEIVWKREEAMDPKTRKEALAGASVMPWFKAVTELLDQDIVEATNRGLDSELPVRIVRYNQGEAAALLRFKARLLAAVTAQKPAHEEG